MECNLYRLCDIKLNKNNPPSKTGGIYALLYHNEIIYIGQSCNLRNRLNSHRRYDSRLKELQNKEFLSEVAKIVAINRYKFIEEYFEEIQYLYIIENSLSERNKLEEFYINKYKPAFNYSGVLGEYYPVIEVEKTNQIAIN